MNKMAESLYGTSHTGLEFPLGELRIEDQSLLTLDVLTANIKGDVGHATVEKQKNILDYFFHEHQPDLILIQESLWTASNIKKNLTSIRASYETTSRIEEAGKRETVLFRVTNSPKLSFEGNWFFNPELEPKELSDYYQAIRERATISSFTAKGRASGTPKTDLFTISWHGQNKCPTPSRSSLDTPTYKINVLRELLEVVHRLNYDSKGHRVPVILGGDFNIDYKLVEGLIWEKWLQSIAPPMPPFRQGNRLLDFFIVTSDVTVDGVYAIPYELDSDGNEFNHVPVLARLTLPLTVTKVRR